MFEESTVWMQTINYFGSTETTYENIDSKIDDVTVCDSVYGLFTNLSYIEDTVAVSLIVFLGSLLNLVVIRCYWRTKSSTALYIQAFAVYDVSVLITLALDHLVFTLFPKENIVSALCFALKGVLSGFVVMGPLFLALDRFLVVVFPHKFKIYRNLAPNQAPVWPVLTGRELPATVSLSC